MIPMSYPYLSDGGEDFFYSLGFPRLQIHGAFKHFDFTQGGRRILVIGPMGAGKTEFTSRIWRDSLVLRKKSHKVAGVTSSLLADRREVFYLRSQLDTQRFPDYPSDALAFRGGYERLGKRIGPLRDSFHLEEYLEQNPGIGTWILDEAAFYEERLIYIMSRATRERDLCFILPTLILNFRKELFNNTAKLLLEQSTDVFPLTAYCEHEDCVRDSHYTYRYYLIKGQECPAPYFDPLIIVGGDARKENPLEPNYCTRCQEHHYLPGKEYTFLELKPLAERAFKGDENPLTEELRALNEHPASSRLSRSLQGIETDHRREMGLRLLELPELAERVLVFLFAEMNILKEEQFRRFVLELGLDTDYLNRRLQDNRRALEPQL